MRLLVTVLMSFGPFIWSGCLPWFGVAPGIHGAVGTTSQGLLIGGTQLPREGEHYRFYKQGNRRFGVRTLTGAIERASQKVASTYPGSVLLVGDISSDTGGYIGGHRSHRSGRDVDFAFFATDIRGKPASGHPLMRFDRFGIGIRDDEVYRFDTARNWALVEALLQDPEAEIQWIFVSNGLKALLLEWGLENDRDLELLARAASVLKQPGDSAPHYDHFHVRIYCPREIQGAHCVDVRPFWPWIDGAKDEKAHFTQEELVELALESLETTNRL
jgi:penicillin-insensitive murein endopeptidase